MDKIQEIKEYINTMKIKKTIFGGYDREDVYSKLGIITEMYQKYIEEIQKSEESMREEYAQKIRQSEGDIAKLQQRIGILLNENQAIVDAKETALEERKTAIKAREQLSKKKRREKMKKNSYSRRAGSNRKSLQRGRSRLKNFKRFRTI